MKNKCPLFIPQWGSKKTGRNLTNKFFNLVSKIGIILFSFFISSPLLAAEETNTIDKVAVFMIIATIFMIALVMWLTVVYSEKNDNNGSKLLNPVGKLYRWLTKLPPKEKEAELLLHHDYDGIQELDNRIPPWFSFLFYGTIIWAVIYMLVFHVFGNGQVQENEYKAEMQQAALQEQILIKTGALLNENTVTLATDAATLSEGKDIFMKNCVTCHGQQGGGVVGPNLTDDYWIHGGGIKNIFTTIKYGVPAKGMISWQTQLAPQKIQSVASYIISLHGTNPPNAKAPEGDKWEETKTDSTKTI